MAYNEKIYKSLKDYFTEDNAHYEEEEEDGYFTAVYSVGHNDCAISSARLHLLVHSDGFTARFSVRGIKAVTKAQPYVGVLLTYINDRLRYGNFEMDMESGEVAFKISNFIPDDAELNYDFIDRIICLGLVMLNKYADALVPIMLGYSFDPKAAYESCRNQDEES